MSSLPCTLIFSLGLPISLLFLFCRMNKEMKMDWMYRDSSQVVDPEEYLLGRKVDKQFEKSSLPPDKDQGRKLLDLFLK